MRRDGSGVGRNRATVTLAALDGTGQTDSRAGECGHARRSQRATASQFLRFGYFPGLGTVQMRGRYGLLQAGVWSSRSGQGWRPSTLMKARLIPTQGSKRNDPNVDRDSAIRYSRQVHCPVHTANKEKLAAERAMQMARIAPGKRGCSESGTEVAE